MKTRLLFIASCVALVTSAFTFVVRGEILQEVRVVFGLSQGEMGRIESAVFLGMCVSMFVGGPICDFIGMKRVLFIAFFCHLLGVLGFMFPSQTMAIKAFGEGVGRVFPADQDGVYWMLLISSVLMGCGNGMTEVAINPLVATLFPRNKTHYLNVLHAWWPGGLMLGGLIGSYVHNEINFGLFQIDGLHRTWQDCLGLILIPCFLYGIMIIPLKFPATERVAVGVTTGDMFKECMRPLFIFWGVCMIMTAMTELGPQKWQESVMRRTTDGVVSGTLILVYTSGMMFVLRHFAGPLAHAFSPVGMVMASSVLSCLGLYLLSYADSPATAFGYATIFGLGVAYYWPTMLGFVAERFPKGGALALALMGTFGNFGVFVAQNFMGYINDRETENSLAKDVRDAATVDGVYDPANLTKLVEDVAILQLLEGKYNRDLPPFLANNRELVHRISGTEREVKLAVLTTIKKADVPEQFAKEKGLIVDDHLSPLGLEAFALTTLPKPIREAVTTDGKPDPEKLAAMAMGMDNAQKTGAAWSFRYVALLPAILVALFGGVWLSDRARGGYQAVHLENENA